MNSKTTLQDFSDLIEIGHGAFGKVYRATYKPRQRKMALKKMSKKQLQKQHMISQINTQIKISFSVKHPNIIKLYDCFDDDENIYLVLELAQNGQLFSKLKKQGRFEEEAVKSMIMDVITAVQYLHSNHPPIIHRDIKPENLLLDKNNKVKLADFGWSNFSNKPRKTYCGTVDYLAPEMIDKSGHDERLDIWCIGVLVYELLTGKTPFVVNNKRKQEAKQTLFANILNVCIDFPEDFPTLAKSFVLGMIKRNPKERMTLQEIKNHPWLKKNSEIIPTGISSPTENTRDRKSFQKIDESVQIISDLNKRISELEEEVSLYKIRQKEEREKGKDVSKKYDNEEENRKLRNEIGKLQVAQQMNQKYKKKQENMWEEMNRKEKQIISLKNQLKKMEDIKEDLEKLTHEKELLQQKFKKVKKQNHRVEEKNRQLEEEIEMNNKKISQRIKNGPKITMEEINSPEFHQYLQQQILDLSNKFDQSKIILNKVLLKQKVEREKEEELIKLKVQEKTMRETIRNQLRDTYENEKDQILLKARNQLFEEQEKWFKERETLKLLYETGLPLTQDTSSRNDREGDMEIELKNIRQLNSYYEKTIKEQKTIIEDLKEDLKRKK